MMILVKLVDGKCLVEDIEELTVTYIAR